jgi:hypothetical protein
MCCCNRCWACYCCSRVKLHSAVGEASTVEYFVLQENLCKLLSSVKQHLPAME